MIGQVKPVYNQIGGWTTSTIDSHLEKYASLLEHIILTGKKQPLA